ncbi:hypothetical protein GCM10009750_18050 [Agromyces salentinus]|uniref:Uncharacterized protein n=1 Tax=Agromyces salentinus TaxID=269421 RepID=A0ABP4Z0W0_9MICO
MGAYTESAVSVALTATAGVLVVSAMPKAVARAKSASPARAGTRWPNAGTAATADEARAENEAIRGTEGRRADDARTRAAARRP